MRRLRWLLLATLSLSLVGCSATDPLDDLYTKNVYPGSGNYTIGSPTAKFNTGYFHDLYVDNATLYIGGLPFSANDTAVGPQGPQGIQGPAGDNGTAGAQGPQGIQGIQGVQGVTGDNGTQGIQGIQGIQGNPGNDGAAGAKGDTGDSGLQGIQGIPGVQGDPGTPGAKGDTGDTGLQGLQGIQGIPGPNTITTATTTDLTGLLSGNGATVSTITVDDVAVDGATGDPISSNWAYDHAAAADPHSGYATDAALANHDAQHAVGGSDTVFPTDPNTDRYLMWDDDPGALVWATVAGGGDMLKATYDPNADGVIAAAQLDTALETTTGSQAKVDARLSAANATDLTDGGTTTLHSHAGGSDDVVYVATPADTAVNVTADATIVTRDVTGVAAGTQLIVEASFIILNNSTATRVYVITTDFDAAFDVEHSTGACAFSATLMHPFQVKAVLNVRASDLAYATFITEGQLAAGIASGTDTTMAATHLRGMGWGTSSSDLTGTVTVVLKVRSANATATQTLRLLSLTIRKVTPT